MTTTNSLLLAFTDAGNNGGFNATTFNALGGGVIQPTTTEGSCNPVSQVAATLNNLGSRVITGVTGTNTMTSRVAGGNGNQVVTFTASTTGWFTDSTHSDSITAGQAYDVTFSNSGFGPTRSLIACVMQRTGPVVAWGQGSGSGTSYQSAGEFAFPFGAIFGFATEGYVQTLVKAAGTWQSLGFIEGAAATATVTFKSRIGGVDGNQVVSVVNPALRSFNQDSTHTDSITAGNSINFSVAATATSGSYQLIYSEFKGTTSAHDLGCFSTNLTGNGQSLSASTSYFWSFSGFLTGNTTEVNAKVHLPYALTLSNLRSKVIINTAATITIKSRKNGADGTCVISVTSGTTGEFADTTHSDSFASGDDMNATGVTGTLTNLGLRDVRATFDDGSNTGSIGYSDSVTEAASAADSPSATQGYAVSDAETATAADSPSAVQGYTVSDSESASAADSLDAVQGYSASDSESATAADSPSAALNTSASTTEAGSAADSSDGTLGGNRSVVETASAADTTDGLLAGDRAVTESGSAVDSTDAEAQFNASAAETASAGDSASATIVIPASASEAASAANTQDAVISPAASRNVVIIIMG